MIRQVRHEQQDKRLSVFLLSDISGGKQQREKQDERKLDERQDLKDLLPKAGHRRDASHVLKAERDLAGRP